MEATKKTSTSKAVVLVVAALSMLLSGLFIATASRSDASPPPACPDGFSLTADAKNCFQAAVVTSADNPNSCDAGQLTPDGTKCYVAASVVPQEGTTECPKGYSPDDSLGGACARFEAASQNDDACPDGARGEAGACYILVAKGPRGDNACTEVGAELIGNQCVITGDDPVNGDLSCADSVLEDASGRCYTLQGRPTLNLNCDPASATYNAAPYALDGGECKAEVVEVTAGTLSAAIDEVPPGGVSCPVVAAGEFAGTVGAHVPVMGDNGHVKVGYCSASSSGLLLDCEAPDENDPNGVSCRVFTDQIAGDPVCPQVGFALIDDACIRYEDPVVGASQCPTGSVEDTVGDCRKPVADADGAYYCKDAAAALNGTSCVFTSGFLAFDGVVLYTCESGDRAVIGAGDAREVICILGDANANLQSGPSCLQGVLSTDNAYCIVPRIDAAATTAVVAAPAVSFTG